MAVPALSNFPPAPVRGEDRADFADKCNAMMAHFGTFVPEMNATIQEINTVTGTILGIQTEVGGVYQIRTEVVGVYDIRTAVVTVAEISDDVTALVAVTDEIAALGPHAAGVAALAGMITELQGVYDHSAAVQSVADHMPMLLQVESWAQQASVERALAQTARQQAEQAKAEAMAIVYEGDYSIEPQPGSVPISRPDGTLDSRWMPDLVDGLNRSALSQAVHLTAAASGDTIRAPSSPVYDLGASDFTLWWRGVVLTPETSLPLIYKYQSSADRWYVELMADGRLRLIVRVGDVTIISGVNSPSTIPIDVPAGSSFSVGCAVERAETSATIRYFVNGRQLGDAIVLAVDRSVDFSNTGALLISGGATSRQAAVVAEAGIFNYAKTAPEILDLHLHGVPQSDRGGSQVPVYESDFSAGTDGWDSVDSDASLEANATIAGESGWLKIVSNITGISRARSESDGRVIFRDLAERGAYSRLRVRVYIDPANSASSGVFFSSRSGSSALSQSFIVRKNTLGGRVGFDTSELITTRGEVVELIAEVIGRTAGAGAGATSNQLVVRNYMSEPGDTIYIKVDEITSLGCTLQLEPESITHSQWHDSSGHGNHALLPEEGATLLRPQYEGDIRWRHSWSGTQEIQYTGGVNQHIIPASAALRGYIDIIASAPVTIDIGDGADQDRYAAAAELVAGRNRVELLTPFHDDVNRKLTVKPTADFTGTLAITAPYEILEDIA